MESGGMMQWFLGDGRSRKQQTHPKPPYLGDWRQQLHSSPDLHCGDYKYNLTSLNTGCKSWHFPFFSNKTKPTNKQKNP